MCKYFGNSLYVKVVKSSSPEIYIYILQCNLLKQTLKHIVCISVYDLEFFNK